MAETALAAMRRETSCVNCMVAIMVLSRANWETESSWFLSREVSFFFLMRYSGLGDLECWLGESAATSFLMNTAGRGFAASWHLIQMRLLKGKYSSAA